MSMTREEAVELVSRYFDSIIEANSDKQLLAMDMLISALTAPDPRVEELETDCERERMRLAACSASALANTPESVAKRLPDDHPYSSASYRDVCDAVDREIYFRTENERLKRELAEARDKLTVLEDTSEPYMP